MRARSEQSSQSQGLELNSRLSALLSDAFESDRQLVEVLFRGALLELDARENDRFYCATRAQKRAAEEAAALSWYSGALAGAAAQLLASGCERVRALSAEASDLLLTAVSLASPTSESPSLSTAANSAAPPPPPPPAQQQRMPIESVLELVSRVLYVLHGLSGRLFAEASRFQVCV